MRNPIFMKIVRDLWNDRARTLLVLFSLTIGIFAVAVVADSYSIMIREMNFNYARTDPSSATLWMTPLNDSTVEEIRRVSGTAKLDLRSTVSGRIQIAENEWKSIEIFIIRDFANMPVDRIYPEMGKWPPAEGEILIERAAMRLFLEKPSAGASLRVSLPGGHVGNLRYAGTAYAPGLAPAWMEGELYGFVSQSTWIDLGGDTNWQELRIQFREFNPDREAVRKQAIGLASTLKGCGFQVTRIEVPKPGEHPHAAQMGAFLAFLEAFGLLALVLSGILAANMISALMSREVRQIGVMKTLGGGTLQIASVYLAMVGFLGLIAMAIALSAEYFAAQLYSQFAADLLNFNLFRTDVELPFWVLQVVVGFLLPLLLASFPVFRGSQVSIREALSDYGVKSREFGTNWFDRVLSQVRFLPSLVGMGIRNAFRRRTRTILTLLTLMAAGICFITAMNVSASMNKSVDDKFRAIQYDTFIAFNRPYSTIALQSAFAEIPGIASTEYWGGARAAVLREDQSVGNTFQLIAPTSDTRLMTDLPVVEGRNLLPSDINKLVINQGIQTMEPQAQVGSTVRLAINGKTSEWIVVGVVWELMGQPTAYTNRESLDACLGLEGQTGIVVMQAQNRGTDGVTEMTRALEARMEADRLDVATVLRMADRREIIVNHLVILVTFLLFMSILVLIVGGLSLASTLSMNIVERRREIGILRANGATGWNIGVLVGGEAFMISILGWFLAVAVSDPISRWITWNFGLSFLQVPFTFAFSFTGILLWLVLSIVFGVLASLLPAWDANRQPVQTALAYE